MVDAIAQFFNSNAGLLVLGFALTTVAGSLIVDRIQRRSKEHETRYQRLHEDRAAAIRDLRDDIIDAEQGLSALFWKFRPIGIDPPDVDEHQLLKQVRSLVVKCEKYQIYFSPVLATEIMELCRSLESAFHTLETALMVTQDDQAPDFEETEFRKLMDDSQATRAKLEVEFRRLIGVT